MAEKRIDAATLVKLRAEAQAALLSPDAATMHRGGLILAFLDDRDALSSALAQAEKERDEAVRESEEMRGLYNLMSHEFLEKIIERDSALSQLAEARGENAKLRENMPRCERLDRVRNRKE